MQKSIALVQILQGATAADRYKLWKTAAKTKIEKQNKLEFEVWNKEFFKI